MTSRKINITHIFSLSLLFVLLVAGCTATPAPVALPLDVENGTATQTATVQPTFTPEPSATRFPTGTPTPTSGPTVPLFAEGPWLFYVRDWLFSFSPSMGNMGSGSEELALINQDGSGRTVITWPECAENVNAFLMAGENPNNYMVSTDQGIYVVRPAQATGMLVYRYEILGIPQCQTSFSGGKKSGLLTSFYRASENAAPELIIYELPGGKIRNRFPLVQCPAQAQNCEANQSLLNMLGSQTPIWSPDGQYLAFAALMNTTSSDLYVYDKKSGRLKQLTSGPDWVGSIGWSPDGTKIIMGEILDDGDHPYAPPPNELSLWSVSINGDEIKMFDRFQIAGTDYHHILFWLDNERYIAYDGDSFGSTGDAAAGGQNLRLVDITSGETKVLFDGGFMSWAYDEIHKTFAIPALESEKYSQGIYLVSINDLTVIPLKEPPYNLSFPSWDEQTGLFITENICEQDPRSYQAFDYKGRFTCVPKPTPEPAPAETDRYPAPNGKWTVFLKDGVWLESQGKPAVQVSPAEASDIVWCPDSSCFFFSEEQIDYSWNLNRVSLPDLAVKKVDEGIKSTGSYQWLGATK